MSDIKLSVENGIARIIFDTQDSKVNILSTPVMTEFNQILDEIEKSDDVKAVVIESAKPGIFIAGADIKEIEGIREASKGEMKAKEGQCILNRLEDLPYPSVALINGAVLGGGLELALACTYRFAAFDPKVQIGLPEVKLGVIPGFGGTKRLPRLVGLQKGLEMILQGKVIKERKAFRIGLVDGLAASDLLFETAKEFFEKIEYKKKRVKKRKIALISYILEYTPFGRALIKTISRKAVLKLTGGHYPAPLKALETVVKNFTASRQAALDLEAVEFGRLVIGDISKNLISIFYLSERYKKEVWVDEEGLDVKDCGVLGAGVMGGGIAQLLGYRGVNARMKDINDEAILLGLKSAQKLFDNLVKKRRIKKCQADVFMGRISPALDYSGFKIKDLVIEAVVENMDIKKKVFAELDSAVSEKTVIASNTSALSVSEMASAVEDPSRVAGMHFFNPVHRMPLVEVIRGEKTGDKAIATIVNFAKKLGKTPIVVKDSCGFLVNRVLIPYLNEGGYMIDEGESFERIDKILLDFGMPMGIFILMDEIGLDVGYKVAKILEEGFGSRMAVAPILKKVCDKGWYGKKSGKGFYIHKGKKRSGNPGISDLAAQKGKESLAEEIRSRAILIMINEAARCLEEGVCREPADVDIGMIMGTGFPPFRGGLLRYADTLGAGHIAKELERFQKEVSELRYQPSEYLMDMVKSKKTFY